MKHDALGRLKKIEAQRAERHEADYVLVYRDGRKVPVRTAVQRSFEDGLVSVSGNISRQQAHIFEQLIHDNELRARQAELAELLEQRKQRRIKKGIY